tara:strand:- start:199 stop:612 length:414 start_codon:yes stop_codon:yes gene_type:complete
MENNFILYPPALLMILTLFLYVKSYLDNTRAFKNKTVKGSYFKAYQDKVPEHIEVSRQTLKNQFELPIFFYFLICVILIFDYIRIIDHIFAWLFVVSRYVHCYIRLTSNYVPHRAKAFQFGLFVLMAWWINFLYYNL